MTEDNLLRHTELFQRFTLECVSIDFAVAGQVQLHIDKRRRQVFHRRKSLVEGCRTFYLSDQLLRYWLACLVVKREPLEHFRCWKPVLQKLRRKFYVIARHLCSGKRRISDI